MTKFINNFYIIPIITYTIYSIYYYFFKKYKSFRGIDSSMITTNDKKYTNIFYTTLHMILKMKNLLIILKINY